MDDPTHHQRLAKAIREDNHAQLEALLNDPQTKEVDLAHVLANALRLDKREASKTVYGHLKKASRLALILDWANNKSYAGPLKTLCYWVAHHSEMYAALQFADDNRNTEMVCNLLPLCGSPSIALDYLNKGVNRNNQEQALAALHQLERKDLATAQKAITSLLHMKDPVVLQAAFDHFKTNSVTEGQLHLFAHPNFSSMWPPVLAKQNPSNIGGYFLAGAVKAKSWTSLMQVHQFVDLHTTEVWAAVFEYEAVELVEPLLELFTDQQMNTILERLPARGIDPSGKSNPAIADCRHLLTIRQSAHQLSVTLHQEVGGPSISGVRKKM